MRVLVVDDDFSVRRALRRSLSRRVDADAASSAAQALELLAGTHFDAVVTDYQMEPGNGVWLLERVRAYDPAIRRIMISGSPSEEIDPHVRSGLVEVYLSKPTGGDEILAAIATMVVPVRAVTAEPHGAHSGILPLESSQVSIA